jgi:hypothetical protein
LTVEIERVGAGSRCTLSAAWRLAGNFVTATGDVANTCGSTLGPFFFLRVDGKRIHGGVLDLGGLLFEGIKVRA